MIGESTISDLKCSAQKVGKLYPVLLDKEGNVIDGQRRLAADASWPKIRLDYIRSERQRLLAGLISNACRRTLSASEKKEMLDRIGKIYVKEGEKLGKLAYRIAQETGMSYRWVMKYLPDSLKARPGLGGPAPHPKDEFAECKLESLQREAPGYTTCVTIDVSKLFSLKHEKPLIARTYTNVSFVNLTLEKRIYEDFARLGGLLGISAETLIGNALLLTLREIEKTMEPATPLIARS